MTLLCPHSDLLPSRKKKNEEEIFHGHNPESRLEKAFAWIWPRLLVLARRVWREGLDRETGWRARLESLGKPGGLWHWSQSFTTLSPRPGLCPDCWRGKSSQSQSSVTLYDLAHTPLPHLEMAVNNTCSAPPPRVFKKHVKEFVSS